MTVTSNDSPKERESVNELISNAQEVEKKEDLPIKRKWYQYFNDEPNGDTSPWLVLFITTIGTLLASCQSSALIIALPALLTNLNATFLAVIWVILAFLLVTTALVPVVGKLGDVLGRAMQYNIGYLIFGVGSLLGGVATQVEYQGWDLTAYRAVQGVGAAMVFANGTALVVDSFYGKGNLGLAIGVNILSLAAGFVIGPVMGGGLTTISWIWVFLINVPFSAVIGVLGLWKMRDTKALKERLPKTWSEIFQSLKKFDYVGSVLITITLTCLLIDLSEIAFPSISIVVQGVLGGITGVGFILFVAWELKTEDPLFDLSLFKARVFTVANVANAFVSFSQSSVTFTILFFFQGPYGKDPLYAGILMIPYGGGIMIMGLLAGILYDKFGSKILSIFGCIVSTGGIVGLTQLTPDTSYGLIFLELLLVGLGSGIFNSPNATSIMAAVPPKQRGNASAVRTMVGNLFRMVSIAVTFALAFGRLPPNDLVQIFLNGGGIDPAIVAIFMDGVAKNLWVAFASSVVSILLCFGLSNDMVKSHKYEFYLADDYGTEPIEVIQPNNVDDQTKV